MPALLQIVLSNAFMATALAIVVFVIASVARRPALAHVLWLLVLIKLITPGIIPLPLSWPTNREVSSESDTTAALDLAAPPTSETDDAPPSEPTQEVTLLIYPDPDLAGPQRSPDETEANVLTPPTGFWQIMTERMSPLWPWLAPLWLAGSLLWLAWTTVHVYRFQRLLRHARLAPDKLQEEVRQWSGKLGLRRPPTLWLVPGRISPMLWCLGRSPRLLFPVKLLDRLDAEQRSALLVHELAHLRRRDHWVRFLEMAVMAVYWWHPVVWWARRELHEAEEQCCDAWVVWALASGWPGQSLGCPGRGFKDSAPATHQPGCVKDPRRAYALALLHTVDFFSHTRPTLPAPASGVGQVPHLRRRLTMIMNGNTSKSLSALGWLGVAAFSLLLPLVPIQAQQAPQKEDEAREQQIENLKKMIRALEDQQRAEHDVHAAALQQQRDTARALRLQDSEQARLAEELKKIDKQKLKANEQQHRAMQAIRQAQLAQSQDAEQRNELRLHRVDGKGNPDAQKIEQMIEDMARAIEVKRQELRGLEEKLQHARVDLEKMRAEGARAEMELRLKARDPEIRGVPLPEIHREPIILKIDPNVSPEQIKAQVEALQGKIKQPIRVEIVSPEKGPVRVRGRIESGADARPVERRDPRGQNLEEKLERIMKEVEELRREMRSSRE